MTEDIQEWHLDHSKLPSIQKSTYPVLYQKAKEALSECARIDECKEWSSKAEALGSYAKQVNDDELEKYARRIKFRALKRCQELLESYKTYKSVNLGTAGRLSTSRKATALNSGLSLYEYKATQGIGQLCDEDFEFLVESSNPPKIIEFVQPEKNLPGKAIPKWKKLGMTEEDYESATDIEVNISMLADSVEKHDVDIIADRYLKAFHNVQQVQHQIIAIESWLHRLFVRLTEKMKNV